METLKSSIQRIFIRDLDKLSEELSLYPNEEAVWAIAPGIKNSAGNLCLHLCGNLQHFIGTILGKTNYVRNRDHEFAARGISRESLLKEIAQTKKVIEETIQGLTAVQLETNYPIDVFGSPMTTTFFLIHLTAHLGYHLGQVNYHRRLIA